MPVLAGTGGGSAMVTTIHDRRRAQRFIVTIPAEYSLGGLAAEGVLRDLGPGGAFVEVGPTFSSLQTGELSELLDVGDQFILTYTPRASSMETHQVVTLRWRGHNDERDCFGYGVQFESDV
jgi:hypothetical protein